MAMKVGLVMAIVMMAHKVYLLTVKNLNVMVVIAITVHLMMVAAVKHVVTVNLII